jgi:xanthine dehydrogenase accessory factor
MPAQALRTVHAPIGLDIGAVSPAEIAVSILAEMIAVRYGKLDRPDAALVPLRWNRLPTT